MPLIFNLNRLNAAVQQGEDSRWIAQLRELEQAVDLENTVFIIHDFEEIAAWAHAFYKPEQRNIIYSAQPLINYPAISAKSYVACIFSQIQQAYQSGKRVLISSVFNLSEE